MKGWYLRLYWGFNLEIEHRVLGHWWSGCFVKNSNLGWLLFEHLGGQLWWFQTAAHGFAQRILFLSRAHLGSLVKV